MILGSFSEYLPFNDLVKIVIACLAVAVIAPAAVSVAVVGRRDHRQAAGRGIALMAVGIVVLVALIVIGLYALATD